MMIKAIVLAAGEGSRFRQTSAGKVKQPKQFLSLGDRPVVTYSLQVLDRSEVVDETVLVSTRQKISFCKELVPKFGLKKLVKVVEGGERRQDSVLMGLKALPPETEVVLIHDGARPFITPDIIEKALGLLKECDGVVVGVPAADTLKAVIRGEVKQTLERKEIWFAQTPQVFRFKFFLEAHSRAQEDDFYGTDDASLVERIGGKVRMLAGDPENIKITTKTDLLLAEAILKNRAKKG